MRPSIASLSRKLLSAVFAVLLTAGLVPAAALAVEGVDDESRPVAEGTVAGSDGLDVEGASEPGPTADAANVAPEGASEDDAQGESGSNAAVPAGGVTNEEMPLDMVIAQAESTKSFFLAQTLESTRTVPMVSAKLPIDSGTDGKDAGSEEDAEGIEPDEGVSAGSTVVGAFEQDGMTFAIEAEGGSVALMAVDYAKLPREFVEKQVIAIPEAVSPNGIDSYSVTRIANGALSSLKKQNANPDHVGARALFSDEELLAEAGIDPSEVEAFLTDEGASGAARGSEDAGASSDMQAQAEGYASEEEVAAKPSEGDGSSDPVDGNDPSAPVESDEPVDPAEADKTSSGEMRTIVSMEGDVAMLDDGSTYAFKNPLAGCMGILAASIPSSVSSIEDGAFTGFDTLQYVVVLDGNSEYASFDGALYSADLTTLRLIPEGRVGAVRIASSATSVDPEVFSHCPSVDALVADADSAVFDVLKKARLDSIHEAYFDNDRFPKKSFSAGMPSILMGSFKCGYELEDGFLALFIGCGMLGEQTVSVSTGMRLSLDGNVAAGSASKVAFNWGDIGSYLGGFRVTDGFSAKSTDIDRCVANSCGVNRVWLSTGQQFGEWKSPHYMWWCSEGYFCITRYDTFGLPSAHEVTHLKPASSEYVSAVYINGTRYEYGTLPATRTTISSFSLVGTNSKPETRYSVNWNSNGGSTIADWEVPVGQSLAKNTAGATSLPAPTRTGWVLDGWYKSNSGFTSANKLSSTLSSTTPTADTTYYARWKISWTWRAYGTTTGATQIVKYSPGDYSTSTAYSAVSITTPSSCSSKPAGWELSTWSRSSSSASGTISPGSTVAPYSTAGSFTYYARWVALIKRDLNMGNSASVDVSNLTTISASGSSPTAAYTPSDVSRTGYTFDGWNVDYMSSSIADDNSKYKGTSITFKGAATIVAQWTPEKRSVTWNATGGTDRTTSADYDTLHTAPTQGTGSTQTNLSGWTLEGWYTDTACTKGRIAPGGKTPAITANTTYYAKWTRTITFKVQGGSGGDKTATATRTGSDKTGTFTTPAAPTRSNWTFKGWTTSATGTSYTAANKSTTSSTATWYARWEMSVTLNANSGTLASGVTSPIKVLNSGTSPFDNHVQFSVGIPVRTGYTFDGWRAGSASGTRVDANGIIPAGKIGGDQTLYAAWKVNTYHLSWDVSHGSHANRTSDFTVEDCPIAMGEATPDAGYSFGGWSGTGIAAGSKSFKITSSMLEGKGDGETLSYAASITANPYTVKLHANDGTDAVVEHGVTYDASVPSPSVPKRYGYVFAGYWTKQADGSKGERYFDDKGAYVRDSGIWKGLSDVDLYACWTLMANLEVPVNAPGTVGLAVDRATQIGEDEAGTLTGESASGALRSAVPQEVPIASIELEALRDESGASVPARILGAGNPERCGVEVSLGGSASALLRLAGEASSMAWAPAAGSAPRIPAATSAPSGATGEGIVTDDLGSPGRMGELPLTYAMRLFPGFDVYEMPATDAASEPAARIVFTVDLTGLAREEF